MKKEKASLERAIEKLVKEYFKSLGSELESGDLHEQLIHRAERELIVQVLNKSSNNQSQTARILGLSRTTLRKKLEFYGL